MGELLGLTWDCVDITPESIQEGRASIYVNKELQRVRKDVMDKLEKKDVLRIFPGQKTSGVTILVLKKPKTETSTRRIFLSKTVAEMLVNWRVGQDTIKEDLGNEYHDFDLVLAGPFGTPMESSSITEMFHELIEKNDHWKVVTVKGYIANAKPNGYRSLHVLLNLPFGVGGIDAINVEIQLRTIAMDCWASLEHQLKYKKHIKNTALIVDELKRCADEMASTDLSMQTIRDLIQKG